MFGSPETTTGGRALKFFASVRLDIRRIGQLKDASGRIVGNRTRLKVVKNKVAPPFTECEFDIMYDEGISQASSVLDLGIEHGIFEKKGAWVSYKGNLIGQGRELAKAYLKSNPQVMDEAIHQIVEKVRVSGGMSLAKGAFSEGREEEALA